MLKMVKVCVWPPPGGAVSKGSLLTFGGEGGLGQVEETQSLVEATHLLN